MRSAVLVRMRDGEFIEGTASGLDLDAPDFDVQLSDELANNKHVLIPFAAVKTVILERRFAAAAQLDAHARKVVVRFWDGEPLKGFVAQAPIRGRHAIQLELGNPGRDRVDVMAIPHCALKGIFYVKSWDGRLDETGFALSAASNHASTPLVDLLGEIRSLGRLREDGSLSDAEFARRRRFVIDRI